jgi:SnoaL-like domain
MTIDTIASWHRIVKSRDISGLDDLLAEDAVFHSPVVHTKVGKALTRLYLMGAFHVLFNDTFRYVREIVGEHEAALEFMVEIEGISVNGIDLIRWGEDGRIVDFKVMLRPLKAINLVHQKMAAMLEAMKKQ